MPILLPLDGGFTVAGTESSSPQFPFPGATPSATYLAGAITFQCTRTFPFRQSANDCRPRPAPELSLNGSAFLLYSHVIGLLDGVLDPGSDGGEVEEADYNRVRGFPVALMEGVCDDVVNEEFDVGDCKFYLSVCGGFLKLYCFQFCGHYLPSLSELDGRSSELGNCVVMRFHGLMPFLHFFMNRRKPQLSVAVELFLQSGRGDAVRFHHAKRDIVAVFFNVSNMDFHVPGRAVDLYLVESKRHHNLPNSRPLVAAGDVPPADD